MKENDKNLRSTLRILRASGVRKFQAQNFTVEFFPEALEGAEDANAPTSQPTVAAERFTQQFDENNPEHLNVLLAGSR